MSLLRPFADHRGRTDLVRRFLGISLVEVVIAQTMLLIVTAGVFSLISAAVKSFHATDGAVVAQIRLREVSHILLRDLQALGGENGRAGDLLDVEDGGLAGSDTLSIYRANPGLCAGEMVTDGPPASSTQVDVADNAVPECPLLGTEPSCTTSLVDNSVILVSGSKGQLLLEPETSKGTTTECWVRFQSSSSFNASQVAKLASDHPSANITDVVTALDYVAGGNNLTLKLGVNLDYRVADEKLERRVNLGEWQSVVEGVYDLQVARGYDLDSSGSLETDEWVGKSDAVTSEEDLPGANASSYFATEIVLVTFTPSNNGIYKHPPDEIFNRQISLSGAQVLRRYRWAKFFMAARNRT